MNAGKKPIHGLYQLALENITVALPDQTVEEAQDALNKLLAEQAALLARTDDEWRAARDADHNERIATLRRDAAEVTELNKLMITCDTLAARYPKRSAEFELLAELKHFVHLALDGRTVRPLNTAKLGVAAYKRDAIAEMGKRVGLLSGPMEKLREQWRRYNEAQQKLQLLQVIITTNESEPPASA